LPDADQAVSAMSNSTLPADLDAIAAVASSHMLYYLEKSVPFSLDADQAVSAMSKSTLPANPDAAASSSSSRMLYYLEPKKTSLVCSLGSHVVCLYTLLLHSM